VAITGLEYIVFSSLRAHGLLSSKPRVIELGESNWYGDVPTEQLERDLRTFVTDAAERDELVAKLRDAVTAKRADQLYEIARIFWRVFVDPGSYDAIDPGTPGSRYQFDLNQPVPLAEQFDFTINIGTAEHVFNVHQFFKTAHDLTRPGGMMMHSSPFTGWPDHGFYCFQPTFFFDLARTNGYEILSMLIAQIQPLKFVQVASHADIPRLLKAGQIPPNTHINVVYRKPAEPREFATPMQAYYAGALSAEHARAWHEMR
jgi:hypothetical protein